MDCFKTFVFSAVEYCQVHAPPVFKEVMYMSLLRLLSFADSKQTLREGFFNHRHRRQHDQCTLSVCAALLTSFIGTHIDQKALLSLGFDEAVSSTYQKISLSLRIIIIVIISS